MTYALVIAGVLPFSIKFLAIINVDISELICSFSLVPFDNRYLLNDKLITLIFYHMFIKSCEYIYSISLSFSIMCTKTFFGNSTLKENKNKKRNRMLSQCLIHTQLNKTSDFGDDIL
jgi:hypothetical protein